MKSFKVVALVTALVVSLTLVPLIAQQAGAKGGEQKININTASLDELQKLPRVGPQVAQRIIDYRKEHGNFRKIEEIMKVRGIGERTFNQLKDLITVGADNTGK
jgi:comEA protein